MTPVTREHGAIVIGRIDICLATIAASTAIAREDVMASTTVEDAVIVDAIPATASVTRGKCASAGVVLVIDLQISTIAADSTDPFESIGASA